MKCKIPEISWHNRDPVLSVDIQPKNVVGLQRLASGGTDGHVLIWYLIYNYRDTEIENINLEIVADLSRHQKAVNVVRWSRSGDFLASGDDESIILIWRLKEKHVKHNICDDAEPDSNKETWTSIKVLRGHMEDVYDLAWSPDSKFLISGSVDNTAIIWDIERGKSSAILQESRGFVQGVAWDPKNRFFTTISSDRSFRVYNVATRKQICKSTKCILPVPNSHSMHGEISRLFHDDTMQSYFRRCDISPDGSLVVVPSGILEQSKQHCTYIYTRNCWKTPAVVLPSDEYTVAVRFCPVIFQLRPENEPIFPFSYRMVLAVASKGSVYFYDTQQSTPIAIVSNIHYTRLTDVTWSSDGRVLIVSSTDGFCSLISFAKNELGVPAGESGQPYSYVSKPEKVCHTTNSIDVQIDKILSVDEKFLSPDKKNKPPTPIAVRRQPREIVKDTLVNRENSKNLDIRCVETEMTQNMFLRVENEECSPTINTKLSDPEKKNPRRVELRTISTPKCKKTVTYDAGK